MPCPFGCGETCHTVKMAIRCIILRPLWTGLPNQELHIIEKNIGEYDIKFKTALFPFYFVFSIILSSRTVLVCVLFSSSSKTCSSLPPNLFSISSLIIFLLLFFLFVPLISIISLFFPFFSQLLSFKLLTFN